jgi:hypothetical protein
MHVKNHTSPHHINSSKIKIKSKSIPRENVDSEEQMPKAKQMFAGKRGSVAEPTLRDSQHFLEKAEQQVNNNHNMVSKSVGHKALMDKIQGNFEPSNLKLASQNMKKVLRNNFKETFGKQSVKRSPRNIQHLQHEHFQPQYCTLDQRQEAHCLQDSLQKAEMSFDSRKKMYSSVQSVNLPQINMKRVVEQPQLRKSASHASNLYGKVVYVDRNSSIHLGMGGRNASMASLKAGNAIGAFVNELDKISSIMLPPEETIQNATLQSHVKQNPYFAPTPVEAMHEYDFGSLIRDYQKVSGNQFYKILKEREMLSSQYSSVASTIVPDRQRQKESSPSVRSNSSQRNFIIRKVSHQKKGKGGKRHFPKDFFSE